MIRYKPIAPLIHRLRLKWRLIRNRPRTVCLKAWTHRRILRWEVVRKHMVTLTLTISTSMKIQTRLLSNNSTLRPLAKPITLLSNSLLSRPPLQLDLKQSQGSQLLRSVKWTSLLAHPTPNHLRRVPRILSSICKWYKTHKSTPVIPANHLSQRTTLHSMQQE